MNGYGIKLMLTKILILMIATLFLSVASLADDLSEIKIFHVGIIPKNISAVEQLGYEVSLIDLRDLERVEDQLTTEAREYLSINIKVEEIAKVLKIGADKSEAIRQAWQNRMLAEELGITKTKLPVSVFITTNNRRWVWYGTDLWKGYREWERNYQ